MRMAFTVGNGDNPDVVVHEEIDDDVGEMLNQIAASGVASQRPAFGEVTNGFD